VLVITRGQGFALSEGLQAGHLLALACAFIWSIYSVLSRRFGNVSTDVVTGFCLATCSVSFLSHLAFEETIWPHGMVQWLAVLALGLLPVGAAFYAWDYGVKRGDIMVLGAAAYAGPLLSTLTLTAAGFASLDWTIALACLLITVGAIVAAKDMIFPKQPA
jgi:drug/metabolite transporter (DMT)-like permease